MIGFEFELQDLKYAWKEKYKSCTEIKSCKMCKIDGGYEDYYIYGGTEKTVYLKISPKINTNPPRQIILTEDTKNTVEIVTGPYFYSDKSIVNEEMKYINEMAKFMIESYNGQTKDISTKIYGCSINDIKTFMEKKIDKNAYVIEIGSDNNDNSKSFENIYIAKTDKDEKDEKKFLKWEENGRLKTYFDMLIESKLCTQTTVTWRLNQIDKLFDYYKKYLNYFINEKNSENINAAITSLQKVDEFIKSKFREENPKTKGLLYLLFLFIRTAVYDSSKDVLKDFTPLLWKSELFDLRNACFDEINKKEKTMLDDIYKIIKYDIEANGSKYFEILDDKNQSLIYDKWKEANFIGNTVGIKDIIKSTLKGENGGEIEKRKEKQFGKELKEVTIYKNGLNGNLYNKKNEFWVNIPPASVINDSTLKNDLGPVLELRHASKTRKMLINKNTFLAYAMNFIKWFNDSQNKNNGV